MDAVTAIFSAVIGVPALIADLLYRFGHYLFNPYAAVIRTCRLLRTKHLSTVVLLAAAFSFFVLSLGIPNTRDLILSFNGGMTTSLQQLSKIETKGREFLYLSLFVLGATVFSLLAGNLIRDVLRLKRSARHIFPDIFNVYVAFTLGWFLLFAIVLTKLGASSTRFGEISATLRIGDGLRSLGLSDVSDIFVSPAFVIILLMSVYFGYRFLRRWGLRRDFVDLLRKDAKGAFSQTNLVTFPVIVALVMIVFPALFLAALSNALFARAESEPEFSYQASCVKLKKQLYTNISVTNNLSRSAAIGPIYLGLWRTIPLPPDRPGSGRQEASQVVQIDPDYFVWASRKGLLLEPSETRYLRLLSTLPNLNDFAYCEVVNNKRRGVPCRTDLKPETTCNSYSYVFPTAVDSDATSNPAPAESR